MAKQRRAKEMVRLLALRRRRGLTWDELSEETGVPRSTLCWWHRRLRDSESGGSRRSEFVEVTVLPPPATALEIVLRDGCRISVPPGFDPEHLRQVIAAVEPRC